MDVADRDAVLSSRYRRKDQGHLIESAEANLGRGRLLTSARDGACLQWWPESEASAISPYSRSVRLYKLRPTPPDVANVSP